MKHPLHAVAQILVLATILASCSGKSTELVVAAYDSMVADYGAGPKLAELFEKREGVKITWVAKGDGGQLLSELAMNPDKPGIDVAVGIDNFLMPRALSLGLFRPYKPAGLTRIPANLRLDPTDRLEPFDYGYFAIIYDSAKAKSLPSSLADFAKPEYARQLILMDPRTSTPGLGFVAWTKAAFGASWREYWTRLRPSILTMTPGWDAGYGLFVAGEAPFVLSYSTSPAYHLETEKTDRYKVLPLSDGGVMQVEFAGILKGAKNSGNAERFMDFLLSKEAQELLPTTQWMYPAAPEVTLPESFKAAPAPAKLLEPDLKDLFADAAKLMSGLAAER